MKKISIFQENSDKVELFDLDSSDLQTYTKKLSSLFELSNVSVLHTSTSSIILRPIKVVSLLVTETEEDEEKVEEVVKPIYPEPIDIITDGD